MKLNERIHALSRLGSLLEKFAQYDGDPGSDHWLGKLEEAALRAFQQNPWFTREEVGHALGHLGSLLRADSLQRWMAPYAERIEKRKVPARVGLVMAGNIPAVGFHDLLCALLAGHQAVVKLSSADAQLIPFMADFLIAEEPAFEGQLIFPGMKLGPVDAVIATGSNNSARYFESYFADRPHIIRKNRNSVAVLTGHESPEELNALCDDIFRYFGLGCRSVSYLFVPEAYDFSALLSASEHYTDRASHHKYASNYLYYKTIFIMNKVSFTDNGILMLTPAEAYSSPVSVVHYSTYTSLAQVCEQLSRDRDQLQCIVSASRDITGAIPPGRSQFPAADDYADGVDTMAFLTELSTFAGQ